MWSLTHNLRRSRRQNNNNGICSYIHNAVKYSNFKQTKRFLFLSFIYCLLLMLLLLFISESMFRFCSRLYKTINFFSFSFIFNFSFHFDTRKIMNYYRNWIVICIFHKRALFSRLNWIRSHI